MANIFNICLPILDQKESTIRTITNYIETAGDPKSFNWILIDNGSNPPISDWLQGLSVDKEIGKVFVHRLSENTGVTGALNKAYLINKYELKDEHSQFLFFSHNDVVIDEPNWDVRLSNFLTSRDNTGVVGFGGSPGIGIPGLYDIPYDIWYLQRHVFLSNMREAEIHGLRLKEDYIRASVLDGFTLIINTELLDKTNGFDPTYIFHNYDNDISMEAIRYHYNNYILGVRCHHYGGTTSTKPDYQEWAKKYGSDKKVHEQAHLYFYNKWKGYLPTSVGFDHLKYKDEIIKRYGINVQDN